MNKILSLCRTQGADGRIMKASGYGAFGQVSVTELEVQPCNKSIIDDFLERIGRGMLYYISEINVLYFFYKENDVLHAVKYSQHYGDISINEIVVEEGLEADFEGGICVYVPS